MEGQNMRWEYIVKVIATKGVSDYGTWLADRLNGLGADGWELVTIWPISTAKGEEYWAAFKRPVLDSVIVQGPTDADLAKAVESLADGMERGIFGA